MWRRLATRSAAAAARVALPARRARPTKLCTHLHVLPQPSQQLIGTTRAFSSRSDAPTGDGITARTIALSELATRPWNELEKEFGLVELKKARQTLPMLWKKLSSDAEVNPDLVEEFFEAATLCKLSKMQLEVFNYMETNYQERVSVKMYGEMFTLLTKSRNFTRMRAIFERATTKFDSSEGRAAPELVYRFGITAAIALDDYLTMKKMLKEMNAKGVVLSTEIKTRVLVAQAKHGDKKVALATVKEMNPLDADKWHEADTNRVLMSLGIAGEPDAAFDFYRRSQSRLSAKTLMTLMEVCRSNRRPKHARAMLVNRRRFGLELLPYQYPELLKIIEELDIASNELVQVLREMCEAGVPFNSDVHAIIARNQQHLHDTPFSLIPQPSETIEGEPEVRTAAPLREKDADKPLIRELLDTQQFAQAAAIVDTYSEEVSCDELQRDQDPEGIKPVIVPDWLADMAVEAYSRTLEVDKVQSLVVGFSRLRATSNPTAVKHALSRAVGLFGGSGKLRNNSITYNTFLAMQFQGIEIFRVRDAIARFKQFQDTEAALKLMSQVTAQIGEALHAIGGPKNSHDARGNPKDFMFLFKKSDVLHFDPGKATRDILQLFVNAKELEKVPAALDCLEASEVPVRVADYENVFGAMYKANDMFDSEDFMEIWEDMTRRGVVPNKAVLRMTIPKMCVGTAAGDNSALRRIAHRAVIEGYLHAAKNRQDNYGLPIACFSALLAAAAESGGADDMNVVYADAVKSLGSGRKQRNLSLDEHQEIVDSWTAVKASKGRPTS